MTLTEAQAWRDAAKAAYMEALKAKSRGMSDRQITHQDITDLRQQWQDAEETLQRLSGKAKPYSVATWNSAWL